MSNVKKIGSDFERRFAKYLSENGWWAHFLSPSNSGAQPFDIIAARDSDVYAIDCKTCADDRFYIDRMEINQELAFQALIWKTNIKCGFAVEHDKKIYYISYDEVIKAKEQGDKSIKLSEDMTKYARSCFERY